MSTRDPIDPARLCEHLRTLDNRAPDLAEKDFLEIRDPYYQYFCEKTMQAYGPDDAPARLEECSPERPCFVRSRRATRS